MLENVVTKKMTIDSANADQISLIINLMDGYNKSKLTDTEAIKNEFFYNAVLTKSEKVFLDTKKVEKKGIRNFLFKNAFQTNKCFIKCSESIQWQK